VGKEGLKGVKKKNDPGVEIALALREKRAFIVGTPSNRRIRIAGEMGGGDGFVGLVSLFEGTVENNGTTG